jgi:hypothetical protein
MSAFHDWNNIYSKNLFSIFVFYFTGIHFTTFFFYAGSSIVRSSDIARSYLAHIYLLWKAYPNPTFTFYTASYLNIHEDSGLGRLDWLVKCLGVMYSIHPIAANKQAAWQKVSNVTITIP